MMLRYELNTKQHREDYYYHVGPHYFIPLRIYMTRCNFMNKP